MLPALQILALIAALLATLAFDRSKVGTLALVATLAFLLGGLPHGAFDIHRAVRKGHHDRRATLTILAAYVGLFLATLALWQIAAPLVLAVFLATAIHHFGCDWEQVGSGALRLALGLAPLAIIVAGARAPVETIFATMAGETTARIATEGLTWAAPVAALAALTALWRWRTAIGPARALAFAMLLPALFVLPPVLGFALYFCAYHTPHHMIAIGDELRDIGSGRKVAIALGLTGIAIALGLLVLPGALADGNLAVAAAFQLLAAVAIPHHALGLIERLVTGRAAHA